MYAPGDEIEGRFVVRELLGAGPLSATYRAEDTFSETAVLLQGLAGPVYAAAPDVGAWGDLVQRHHLESGYVAPPRATLVDGARARLLMVLAPAGPLAGLRSVRAELEGRGAPLRHAEAQLFGSQIALGLSALHRAGLVHGDLRSQNVLIRGGHALLVGVGVVPAVPPSALDRIFAALPADPYRAPELAETMRPSPAADMYAAAVILAEMLGYFDGATNIDPGLSTVLARALATRPQDRFSDIDAFAAALVTAFERAERKLTGRPTPSPRTPPSSVPTSPANPSPGDVPQGVRASFGEPAAFVAGALDVPSVADSGETPPLARLGRPHPKVMLDPRALTSATPATPLPRTPALILDPPAYRRSPPELPPSAGARDLAAPPPPPAGARDLADAPPSPAGAPAGARDLTEGGPDAAELAPTPPPVRLPDGPGSGARRFAAAPGASQPETHRAAPSSWGGWLLAAILIAGAATLVTSVFGRVQSGRAAEAQAERRYREGRAAAEKAAAELAAAERAAAERAAAAQATAQSAAQVDASPAQGGALAATSRQAGAGPAQLSGTAAAAPMVADGAAAAGGAQPAPCPQGMIRLARATTGSYCISSHEFPGKGALPGVKVRKDQAARVCAARGARLCTRAEWENACSAGGTAPFAYGSSPVRHRCNTGAASSRKRLVPGGDLRGCRTAQGVYDMIGNAAEWVEEGVVMGGDVRTPLARATCENARPVPSGDGSSWIGFRCCAD